MQKEVDYFNRTSEQYLKEYDQMSPEGYSFRIRQKKVISLISEAKTGEKALDIGCGPGIMAPHLLKKGYRVCGVDAAPEMISLAQKKWGIDSNVDFQVGNAKKLDFEDNSFELVIAMGLLEYFDSPEKIIAEIRRVLKNNGTAILTFPNKNSLWRTWNRMALLVLKPFRRKKNDYSLKHQEFIQKEAEAILKNNGLITEKVLYYNFKIIPHPFDKIFPALTIRQSRLFENWNIAPKFIGTGFIIRVVKK